MKRYENLCFEKFSKIFLFSKKEISSLKRNKKKIQQINFGIDKIQRKFKFNKKNNRILFIGNIKYLPNKIACKSFINNILPQINKTHQEIEFHIIGEISKFDAFIWSQNKSVKIHGKISNLNNLLSKTFCGLANLNVSSGIQTKLLTYMSYGIPSVSSKQVLENFDAIHSLSLPKYKNKKELIQLILKLKNEKKFSQNISRKSLEIIKRFTWEKVLKDLNKLSFDKILSLIFFKSDSTISFTRLSNFIFGFHPSLFLAFVGSANRVSTSAGLKNFLSIFT